MGPENSEEKEEKKYVISLIIKIHYMKSCKTENNGTLNRLADKILLASLWSPSLVKRNNRITEDGCFAKLLKRLFPQKENPVFPFLMFSLILLFSNVRDLIDKF